MNKTQKIIYSVGTLVTATSISSAVAIPLAIKSVAEKRVRSILEKLIPLGGPENSLAGKDKINYYSIGDSVAAGYNGYMALDDTLHLDQDASGASVPGANKTDYLSYADFLANSLAKMGKLGDYRNFASSGDKVPDSRKRIFRDPIALKALKKSDLVTISLGANDLLSAVEFLKISFGTIMNMITGEDTNIGKSIVEVNLARDRILNFVNANNVVRPDGQARDASTASYASRADMARLIGESFDKLTISLQQGNLSGLVDMEQELLDKIFDIIQLDLGTFISEVHQAAPGAKIIVMGYAFPFHLFPENIINVPLRDRVIPGHSGPATVRTVFNAFIDNLKTMCDRANYVDFFDVNQLKEFSKESDLVDYTLKGDTPGTDKAIEKRSEWDRVMPNALDIHPSTYGHQVIGGYLFQHVARDIMDIKVPDYQSVQKIPNFNKDLSKLDDIYTYAGLDQGFDIRDETTKYEEKAASTQKIFTIISSESLLRYLGHVFSTITSGKEVAELARQYLETNSFVPILNGMFTNAVNEQSKLGMGLIALILYYGKGGTEVLAPGEKPGNTNAFIIKGLLSSLGGSIDLSKVPLGAIGYGVGESVAKAPYNNDYAKYLVDLVELGKKIGFDISAKLPANWNTDSEVARHVFQPGTETYIASQSYLEKALAKLSLGTPFNMQYRIKTIGETLAKDSDHQKYWINSFGVTGAAGSETGLAMGLTIDDTYAKYSLIRDEIAKTIVEAPSFAFTVPSQYWKHITLTFTDVRDNRRHAPLTLDLSSVVKGSLTDEAYKTALIAEIKKQLDAGLIGTAQANIDKATNEDRIVWEDN